MAFIEAFEKRAESSARLHAEPWSQEIPHGQFTLRFHPKRRRWSCDCQDFEYRRSLAPDEASFQDKSCKHIKSHLLGQNPKMIRADEIATGYKFPVDSYKKPAKSKGDK